MGNCAKASKQAPDVPLKRNLHDERKCGVSLSIAKSNQKMGIETSCTGTMTHDLQEEVILSEQWNKDSEATGATAKPKAQEERRPQHGTTTAKLKQTKNVSI